MAVVDVAGMQGSQVIVYYNDTRGTVMMKRGKFINIIEPLLQMTDDRGHKILIPMDRVVRIEEAAND